MGPSAARLAPPAGVDAEQIEAKTHDGVVAVTIPLPERGQVRAGSRSSRPPPDQPQYTGPAQPFDVAGPGAPRSGCSALTLGIPHGP